MDYFKIRNWETYQHYKHRDPPWIKLYRTLLQDFEYRALPDNHKSHLIGVFLLAATSKDGIIPANLDHIAECIGANTRVNLDLLTPWIIPCRKDGTVLAYSASIASTSRVEKSRVEKSNTCAPAARRASRPARKQTGFQACLETFKARHLDCLGLPYDETHYARDNKALTGPLNTYGQSAVCELIGYFWDEHDKRERGEETWIGKTAPSIPAFVSKIPLILRDYEVESYGTQAEQESPEGGIRGFTGPRKLPEM